MQNGNARTSSSTKFKVSRRKQHKYSFNEGRRNKDGKALKSLKNQNYYEGNYCTEVLQGSIFSPKTRLAQNNGFVNTVVECYKGQHCLTLRPDDIWAAIMTQLSFYINANAQEFRGKFVDIEKKKELSLKIEQSIDSVTYDLFAKLIYKEVNGNLIDPKVKSWILPSFSTTTDDDLISCAVVFMASMKNYPDSKFVRRGRGCGIPIVNVEGSVADWEYISNGLEKLKEFKLHKWYKILKPILNQFIQAKKGKSDVHFWQKMCSCGAPGSNFISGWITAFCVFDQNGKWQVSQEIQGQSSGAKDKAKGKKWPKININDISPGVVELDVKIDDNGAIFHASMFSGHIAFEVLDDLKTLQPKIGWAIALKPYPEEIKKYKAIIEGLIKEEEENNCNGLQNMDQPERKKHKQDDLLDI